jgi:hypothetical protein
LTPQGEVVLNAVVGMELLKEAIDVSNTRDEIRRDTEPASLASTAHEAASGSKGGTSRSEHLERLRSRCATELEFKIESSKEHWTELDSETSLSGEELVAANREVFERLMEQFRCPKTGECFFHDWGESLTLGAKIAEGGQAEIFSAKLRGEDGSIYDKIVVKAFKSGYCLKDLEHQWPQGMFVTKSMEHQWPQEMFVTKSMEHQWPQEMFVTKSMKTVKSLWKRYAKKRDAKSGGKQDRNICREDFYSF